MKKNMHFIRSGILMGVIFFCLSWVRAESEGDHLLFNEVCVREKSDQTWSLRIQGRVPSMAGCYVIVHEARGNLVLKEHIPYGDYTGDRAQTLTIPKDGWVGEYRLVVVGRESDIRGLELPLTDLKSEVYGRTLFATRARKPLWFLAEKGEAAQKFSGTSGVVQILKDGKPLVDAPQVGELYSLDTSKTFYFKATPGAYVSFSSERVFLPDANLEAIAWWQLTDQAPRFLVPTSPSPIH